MKHRNQLIAPVAALLVLVSCQAARAAAFDVDGAHTSVVFSVSHLGYSYTYGMFRKAAGKVEYDTASPEASEFALTIDVDSLDTMNSKRDEHLKNADFFNAKQFPQITFESTGVKSTTGEDGKQVLNVTGKLTMHGVTKEVTLPLQVLGEGPSPFNDYRVGFLCQTTLKRSDFGMEFMVGPVGDKIGVTVSFEAVRK